MKGHKKHNSLSRRLLIYVLICSSFFTVLSTVIQLYFDYRGDLKTIDNNMLHIRNAYLPAISKAVFHVDEQLQMTLLDGVLNLQNIEYLEITENWADQKIIKHKGAPLASKDLTKIFPLIVFRPGGKKLTIGTLNVYVSYEGIYQRLWDKVIIILITNAVKTFIAAICIFFIFQFVLSRHLYRIAKGITQIDFKHKKDFILTLDRRSDPHETDVLDIVVDAINEMVQTQKNSMRELKKSELFIEDAINSLTDTFFVFDPLTGKAIKWNKKFSEISGYSDEEIQINKFPKTYYNEEDLKKASAAIETIEKEGSVCFEMSLICKKGNTIPTEYSESFIRDENGQPLYIVASGRDKRDRLKVEERLRQAQKMEAIGTLAGGIAHDFNNILGGILGNAELAREYLPYGSEQKLYIEKVLMAGEKARDLVQHILAFSRQEEIEKFPLKPSPIIKEALKLLRSTLPATITIHENIESQCGVILADPTQVHQILMNLSTNAFHAMEETGGILDVTLKNTKLARGEFPHEPDLDPGMYVKLTVQDNGPGMPPDIKNKIFDPYFTTKVAGKGTGMGLSIVHGIVKDYGGSILVYSEVGEGTTFHVFLPVIQEEVLPEDQTNSLLPVGNERILFIDDEKMLTSMGKTMLETLGYHVTVFNNSIEAFQAFQNQPNQFDLIVTDQTMPHMTGSELSKKMIEIRSDIPIILCTGHSSIISEDKTKSMGIKEFVLKPLLKKELAMLIRKVLDMT
jgi:PAS domain S-box-containing protein